MVSSCTSNELTLNTESAAVLLRCLSYGQAAISREIESGVADVVETNIRLLRQATTDQLAKFLIEKAATKEN